MNLIMDVSLVPVDEIEDATHVLIIDKQLGNSFSANSLYEIHKEEYKTYNFEGEVTLEQHYVIDDKGKQNYSFYNCFNTKLYKLEVK